MFLYKSTILSKNQCSRWLQLCVKLFPAFIQIIAVSTHNSYCSLENCEFHILLIGSSFDQILQRLSNFNFTYRNIDCLYTLYKYSFYSNVISSTGEVFKQLDRAVHHNLKWKGAEEMASVAKKRLLRKKSKCHYLCSNQKLASTQTIRSAFLERICKV